MRSSYIGWGGLSLAVFGMSAAIAQPVINPSNRHAYLVTPARMTWTEAEEFAVMAGGHLATIRSAAEQSWINTTFLSGTNVTRELWIGLNDAAIEGTFKWSSGEPVVYTNFTRGEPNNLFSACSPQGEDYCTMNWYRAENRPGATVGEWNDTPVQGTHYGFCVSTSHPGPFGLIELVDSDGDGIWDDWERDGVPYKGSNGEIKRYVLPDADYLQKDVYVEVDAMSGCAPSAIALSDVVAAFRRAPVYNPGGIGGVSLHLLDGGDVNAIPFVEHIPSNGQAAINYCRQFFGSKAERESSDPAQAALLAVKRQVIRHCLFANAWCPANCSSGMAAGVPSNEFFVAVAGSVFDSRDPIATVAGTFMHELGHTLGLTHGGARSELTCGFNYKPNYYSVMNYLWQMPVAAYNGWRLDYSREAWGTLNESALEEGKGLGVPVGSSVSRNLQIPWGGFSGGQVHFARARAGSPVDWDQNGSISTIPLKIGMDINYPGPGWCYGISVLGGFNDWHNISYDFSQSNYYKTGVVDGAMTSEMTPQMLAVLDSLPHPPPLCGEDLNSDGLVDDSDFVMFLPSYNIVECIDPSMSQGCPADFNIDGIVNDDDFLLFLKAYNDVACP